LSGHWPPAFLQPHLRGIPGGMVRFYNIIGARLTRFSSAQDGAVTVDWVVVTAGVVGLAIAIATSVGDAAQDQSKRAGDAMVEQGIKTY